MVSAAISEANTVSNSQEFIERRSLTVGDVTHTVQRTPGQTSAELSQLHSTDRSLQAMRLSEAANQESPTVYKGTPRVCRITQRTAITWWPQPQPQ